MCGSLKRIVPVNYFTGIVLLVASPKENLLFLGVVLLRVLSLKMHVSLGLVFLRKPLMKKNLLGMVR